MGRLVFTDRAGWIGLLLLVIVGHDLIMTADANSTSLSHTDRAVSVMSHDESDTGHHTLDRSHRHQPADHSESTDCGTTRFAVLPGIPDRVDNTIGVTGLTPDLASTLIVVTDHRWDEPTSPPGVRRALVQVYRI